MNTNLPTPSQELPSLRIFGVGDTGLSVIDLMIADGLPPNSFAAVNAGGQALESSAAAQKIPVENKRLRGLGSGGDPERGRQAAEEKAERISRRFDTKAQDLAVVLFWVDPVKGGVTRRLRQALRRPRRRVPPPAASGKPSCRGVHVRAQKAWRRMRSKSVKMSRLMHVHRKGHRQT